MQLMNSVFSKHGINNTSETFFFLALVEARISAQPHMGYMCCLSLCLCEAGQDPAACLAGT